MGFNILIFEGEIGASVNCMGPQFICTDWPRSIKILQQTYHLNFAVTERP
jgi:hypothetical protein